MSRNLSKKNVIIIVCLLLLFATIYNSFASIADSGSFNVNYFNLFIYFFVYFLYGYVFVALLTWLIRVKYSIPLPKVTIFFGALISIVMYLFSIYFNIFTYSQMIYSFVLFGIVSAALNNGILE